MGAGGFVDEWERHYVMAVRHAARAAYARGAWLPVDEVYLILAEELAARGIDPEPNAVFEGARVISRGGKPAVLAEPPADR